MIRVRIGDSERELSSISEGWVNQQINRRRADGQNVCVRVIIRHEQLNMTLWNFKNLGIQFLRGFISISLTWTV